MTGGWPHGGGKSPGSAENIDDRFNQKATLITSQLLVAHWHEYLGEPTVADAVLERLLHSAHRLELKGALVQPA